jgi:hypothetical protein
MFGPSDNQETGHIRLVERAGRHLEDKARNDDDGLDGANRPSVSQHIGH